MSDQHAPRSLIVTFYGAYGRSMPRPGAGGRADPAAGRGRRRRAVRPLGGLPAQAPRAAGAGRARRRARPGTRCRRRPAAARRRRPAGLRGGRAPDGRRLGARRLLRARVGAAEAARAALPAGRPGLRHGRPRGVDRPGPSVRGDPAHPGAAAPRLRTSTCSAASTWASPPRPTRSPAGGTWRRSPSSTRPSSTGTSRVLRAWERTRRTRPTRGGVPRLPARPGLLAPSPLRRPRSARRPAARGLAGRPLGPVFGALHDRLRDAGAEFAGVPPRPGRAGTG